MSIWISFRNSVSVITPIKRKETNELERILRKKMRYFVPNLTFFLHIWEIICNFAPNLKTNIRILINKIKEQK